MRTPGNLFSKVWRDIRSAENYDLSLVLLGTVIVVSLDLFSIPVHDAMDSITLAVLALVTVGLLGNRWRLNQVGEAIGIGRPLLLDRDGGIERLFSQSHEIWLMGVSRSGTIARQFPVLESVLRQGGKVRVLMVDPRGVGPILAGDRHYVPTDENRCRAIIYQSLSDLSQLHESANEEDSLRVAVLDFVPAFGLTLVDPDSSRGAIQVYLYSHWARVTPLIPQLFLTPKDVPWYNFYRRQMEILWGKATEWEWDWPIRKRVEIDSPVRDGDLS